MSQKELRIVSRKYSQIAPKSQAGGLANHTIVSCALILSDGTPQPPTFERYMGETERQTIVGQYVVPTSELNYESDKIKAYENAIERLTGYGIIVVD